MTKKSLRRAVRRRQKEANRTVAEIDRDAERRRKASTATDIAKPPRATANPSRTALRVLDE